MRAEKQLLSPATLQDLCLPALSANHKLYGTTRNTGVHDERKKDKGKKREGKTNKMKDLKSKVNKVEWLPAIDQTQTVI